MAIHVGPTRQMTNSIELVSPTAAAPSDSDGADGPTDGRSQTDEASAIPSNLKRSWRGRFCTPHTLATLVGASMLLALAALATSLAIRAHQSQQADQQRLEFLETGRQGAINLTTIDHRHADADVQRILESATGQFYDDFSKRSQPFVDVVKQVQSTSEGTVTAAGIESETDDGATVLVAVTVKTSTAAAPQQDPRSWRMRVSVQRVEDHAKVSNVSFVP